MTSETAEIKSDHPCRVLSLDGGGAKGFYTLGVLHELEALIRKPMCEGFGLIFGTSTGAIIGALLGLGCSVDAIHELYKEYVPAIMRRWTARRRTEALECASKAIFGELGFEAFRTHVGIVATRWDLEKPMIFKNSADRAFGRKESFVPGFGCSIAEAVIASCSAYPFFTRRTVTTSLTTGAKAKVELFDGGYCANNPALYAVADAAVAARIPMENLRFVSIGVGEYPEPSRWRYWFLKRIRTARLLQKTLNVNTNSMEQLRAILFKDIQTVRVSEAFPQPEMATDLMESDLEKLNLLFQRGRESFARHENDLKRLLL
ncbi:MAG: patatin-like phospholipase family protein [Candidatus Binataceae bacterium]